jgi:transmembrane sensor
MTRPDTDWETLGRWLAGESSPEEAAQVARWLEQYPTEAAALEAINLAARKISPEVRVDVEAALLRVKARRTGTPPRGSVSRFANITRRLEMYGAAAAILLVAGIFGAQQVFKMRGAGAEVGYTTGIGQRDSVTLEDGSMVVLGPSSRVSVRGRDVELTGQAFFRVTHDASSPFTVRAGRTVIRDIGTEFSVDSDTSSQEVRVVVREGSVALSRGSDSVTLVQGDVGTVAETGRVEARRGVATAEDLAWMRGELVFRDTPMRQVAVDLRRWYGVELRMTDSVARRVFTGTYASERADRVLEAIGLALGARIERRADTAFIAPATPTK